MGGRNGKRVRRPATQPGGNSPGKGATLGDFESTIQKQDFESAAAFKDGVKLFEKDGEAAQVQFTPEEIALMKDAILTHNHPSNRSLSLADILLYVRSGAKEMRATGHVSPIYALDGTIIESAGYDYSISGKLKSGYLLPDGTPDFSAIQADYQTMNLDLKRENWNKIDGNQMSMDYASATHNDDLNIEFAKLLGLTYTKTKRK